MNKKQKDAARMKENRRPDKPCIRCGHSEEKALRVMGKTARGEKVVLCLNCRANLES